VRMSPASYSGFIAKMNDMGAFMFPSASCSFSDMLKVSLGWCYGFVLFHHQWVGQMISAGLHWNV
jgi:hypothetical protein